MSWEKQKQHLTAIIRLKKTNMLYVLYKTTATSKRMNIEENSFYKGPKEG